MLWNYSFLIDGVVAGCARPGAEFALREDLTQAWEDGVRGVVTLTESPLERALVEELGMRYLHLPIVDYTPPTLRQMNEFVEFVDHIQETEKGATLVHCMAGIGRTGTMLAAYLIAKGQTPSDAIATVRRKRPGSIETREQERSLIRFAESLA